MNIIAYDPYINDDESSHIKLTDFETVLKESDFITFHVPLTKNTYHLIGKKEFQMMKKGVILINCARGGIIDEQALYQELSAGKEHVHSMFSNMNHLIALCLNSQM